MMPGRKQPSLSEWTLVLMEGNRVLFSSKERGIAPLLECLERFAGHTGRCTLHDRVTGLAAARLTVLSGFIAEVVTRVVSTPAQAFLTQHGIKITSEVIVPRIFNRNKTGLCPAETIALQTEDPQEMIVLLSGLRPPSSHPAKT